MTFNVLVTVPWFKNRPAPELDRLREAGCEVTINREGKNYDDAGLIDVIPGIHATIASSESYNERTLTAASDLKVVARMGVGFDQIDVDAATRHKVAIAMAFGTNHEAVADHAFAMLAALGNQILPYQQKVMAGGWGGHFHKSLWGATVGIIGLGRIGRALARRCAGFEMRLLAYDIAPDQAYAVSHNIEMTDLDTLLKKSDFVSVNAPHTPLSDKMINTERLSLMKLSAYLINTARGGLVDQDDLYEVLQSQRIAGAGLDVFAVEPLPADAPLRSLDNVIVSPHCAGVSDKATELMLNRCIDSILAIKEGRNPGDEFLLNPGVFG